MKNYLADKMIHRYAKAAYMMDGVTHMCFHRFPSLTVRMTITLRTLSFIYMDNSFVSTYDKCKAYIRTKYFNIILDLRQHKVTL
jgi:hypothetical protein